MSDIHLYYNFDQTLHLCRPGIVGEEMFFSPQAWDALEGFLRKITPPRSTVSVFFDAQHATQLSMHAPIAFSTEDIVDFIYLEQARLFPTLERDIYFDFNVTEKFEDTQLIHVIACNKNFFAPLEAIFSQLNLQWIELSLISKQDVASNLLPWRQFEKKLIENKLRQNIYLASLLTMMMMLIFSLWLFCETYTQRHHYQRLNHMTRKDQRVLEELSRVNNEYKQLNHQWQNYSEVAKQQKKLSEVLEKIEISRPKELVLTKIFLNDPKIILQGDASNSDLVKNYLTILQKNNLNPTLEYIKNIDNSQLSPSNGSQFQISLWNKGSNK